MPHDLVTIAVFPDAVSAQAVRGHLEAHGVRAFVLDEHTTTLMPHLDMALGVRLQVPRGEAQEALALIAEAQKGAYALDDASMVPGEDDGAGLDDGDAGDGDDTSGGVPSRGHAPPQRPVLPADRAVYRTGEAPWLRWAVVAAIVAGAIAAVLWLGAPQGP